MSSRWYGKPGQYAMRKTGVSTVGVLVYLDGSRPFRSWDGDMVRALVCFGVDDRLVRVATGPTPQAPPHNGGGVQPQQQPQQQPLVYGPPPPPPPQVPLVPAPLPMVPTEAAASAAVLPPQLSQADAPPGEGAAVVAAPPAAVVAGGGGEAQQQQQQGAGGQELLPCPPAEEEIAPWASAAASAALEASGTHLSGGRGGAGGGARGGGAAAAASTSVGVVGIATPGLGPRGSATAVGGGGAVVSSVVAVPETSAALGLALPKDRDLFPTVTIHSANTEVRRMAPSSYRSRLGPICLLRSLFSSTGEWLVLGVVFLREELMFQELVVCVPCVLRYLCTSM